MSHATKPARLLVAERPQRERVPARIVLAYAAAVYLFFLAVLRFEEHDLIRSLGGTYAAYRARVPALIPRPSLRRRRPGAQRSEENDPKQAT